ncbi:unnamed protein product [Hydatigera taeniaeformis]|uniref:Ectonucleotide pyrophosphatase/phosphodiesterase family member 5 n=1 Tax=Hydatigena taeniaeformis TaxID=6205 RepID=A0A0R3X8L3_HYDTA|nr:unnamed protein product [Hydatigera taeniaeformis]
MRGAIWGQALLLIAFILPVYCRNKVIFISFDGFRHDYLDMAERKGKNISAFKHIRDSGFQAEVQNVMLTLTFPSHYAMATGRTVEDHGLVANKFYDPDLKMSFSYKKPERNMESPWFEYAGAEPLWATNERHGGRSCVFQWVGSEARVHDKMAFATSGLYTSEFPLYYRIDRIMDWISRDEFNLAMMYYNQPDSNGHRYGPDSDEVMDAVEEINGALAYLLQRIEQMPLLQDRINIVISADHGMTSVDPTNKVIDLYSKLSNISQHIILDSSSATLGLWSNDESIVTNEDLFKRINGTEHLSVYLKKDIPERYYYKKNLRIAPHTHIHSKIYGAHGYDNEEPDMHPFMLAMGPDIPHFADRQHFYQIDLYPYICAMLGLDKPNKIDGLIDRVFLLLLTLVCSAYCTNKVLFISFDGFRHDYLDMAEKEGRNISAFKQVREAGFQAEVQNVMITLTFPSHYAMATGRNVENHGLVGNNFYDVTQGKKYNYKKSERNIESVWFEYAGAEPLWATNERHGGRSCVFQWGKVNIVISADHGMAYVDPNKTVIDLYTPLKNISSYLMLDLSPATLGIRNMNGMHGYDNEEPDMHPFMLAMGPDIPHFADRQHFYQIDLYPYICAMLGLDKPNKIDGLIDRVVPFLKNKPSEEYLQQFRLYASGALTP